MFINLVFWFSFLPPPPSLWFSRTWLLGTRKWGPGWPTQLFHQAVLIDKSDCYNDAGCLHSTQMPLQVFSMVKGRKKKKPLHECCCSVGCRCKWLTLLNAFKLPGNPRVRGTNVGYWKSKGPNLNFIIQPDTADPQNVLSQNYDTQVKDGFWLMGKREWLV